MFRFELKQIIILIAVICFSLPVTAIEDNQVVIEEQSSNFNEISEFTGETFFKSYFELQEERALERERLQNEYYHKFNPNYGGTLDEYMYRRSKAPVRIMRDSLSKKIAKFKENRANKKSEENKEAFVDANGMPIEEAEEENEVLSEENEAVQTLIKCKLTKYLPETGEIEGTGDVSISFPEDGIQMYSDKMTYNTNTGIIQLFDNVKVIQNGETIYGDYMKIDTNDESGLLKNPKLSNLMIDLVAENGYMFGDTIVTENGRITSKSDSIYNIRSSGFGEHVKRLVIPREELNFVFNDVDNNRYVVKVNEIKINSKSSHDTIKLKNPKIYSSKTGKKILSLPSLTFYTNKEKDYIEANYPELGSFSSFGMYAGPGVVFEAPFGSTLKLLPTVNYQNKFGFGFLGRFQSASNKTEFGYNTASSMYLVKGIQRIDDHLLLQYGANAYMNNWFLGSSWVGQTAELLYERGFDYRDFLYENADLNFRHRLSFGYIKENEKNRSNKTRRGYHDMSTLKLRYMAQFQQKLYSMFNEEDRTHYDGWRKANLYLMAQGVVSLYGTGDTQIIGRIGPRVSTQYKNWFQDVGVFFSATEDNTPFRAVDAYRYGRSSVYLREYWRVCRLLTLGLYTTYNLSGSVYDSQSDRDKLREATFYLALGPDDFKVNLGYDFIRENTYFGLSMALVTKNSTVDYKKFEIKNPETFGKVKGEPNDIKQKFFEPPPSPYRTKAVVSNVEDKTTYIQGEPL